LNERLREWIASSGGLAALLMLWACASPGGGSQSARDAGFATQADAGGDRDTETRSPRDYVYDWDERVDETWGPAPDAATRGALFEEIWQTLRSDYACFDALGADWTARRDLFATRIAGAESFGRFAQVLMDLTWDLEDPHTYVRSERVCRADLSARPPISLSGVSTSSSLLGVCATATDSGELVVYRTSPQHNLLGLEIGDEILGYDDEPWAENLARMEAAALPRCGRTSPVTAAREHSELSSAPMNAHLFHTVQLRRTRTGETESVELGPVLEAVAPEGARSTLLCTSQLRVDGVPFPARELPDLEAADGVSWGILPGTNIGYIYVYRWLDDDALAFEAAVDELWNTDGLIIDQRFNLGGRYVLVLHGLPMLFGATTPAVDFYSRVPSSEDPTAIEFSFATEVLAAPETSYDEPIAVLIGPDAMSGGDLFPYVMAKHPRARLFGKPTAGGFGGIAMPIDPDDRIGDLTLTLTDRQMVEPTTDVHLEGYENTPDTPVWLTKADIHAGVDTVVAAARAWIESKR
jgi:hypothetical protein